MKSLGRHGSRACGLLLLMLSCLATPVWAQTLTVTTTGDTGPGSLREAMTLAIADPDPNEIVFAAAANGVVSLASALPELTTAAGALTIAGNGAANTIIDGMGQHGLLKTADGHGNVHLTVRGLTLRNGRASRGAAILFGGGSTSSLTVDEVDFVTNYASIAAAIFASGPVTIENSLFRGNRSPSGSAAMEVWDGPLLVRNSTFSGNDGEHDVLGFGGAVQARARLVNVTMVDNLAGTAVIVRLAASMSISNSLFARNVTNDHDLQRADDAVFDTAASFNNILEYAGNSGIQDGVDGNQVGVTVALVGALGSHDGPIQTVPLLPGSPALNAGTSADTDVPALDQRGHSRVGSVDVGAFESQGFVLTRASGSPQSANIGAAFADPLVVEVSANNSVEPVEGGWVGFSAPASGATAELSAAGASIDADGHAQVTATANATVGGPYLVDATIANGDGPVLATDFSLTNVFDPCAVFAFPYTLSAPDNAARVVELREAIDCANANASDDVIDLGGNTLTFDGGPYTGADGAAALPVITSAITLRNGRLERAASAPVFRFLLVEDTGTLTVQTMQLRGGSAGTEGGAILARGPLTLRGSVFEANTAVLLGGAVSAYAPVTVLASHFTANAALDGAAVAGRQMLFAMNSRFDGNGNASTASVLWGDFYVALLNNLFVGNQLPAAGSSLMVFTANLAVAEMRNVTIADNAVQGELLRYLSPDPMRSIHAMNSIFWGNQASSLGRLVPIHSIVPGVAPVNGNLDAAPGFVDAPNDYRLASWSPAIDAGDNDYLFADAYDVDGDGDLAEMLDLGLDPRLYDDAAVVDTGNGTAPMVDIGAYERQADSVLPTLSVDDVSVVEGDSGTVAATFTITLTEPAPPAGVGFDIATADGTATASDGDYVASNLTGLVIAAGQSSTTFVVTVNGDTALEPGETFFVNVTGLANAIAGDTQGTGAIFNDDADPCAAYVFPYTLGGADNDARVAELRQAVECANANAGADAIDLGGNALVFSDAPYVAAGANALPVVTDDLTLHHGAVLRDTGAPEFRFLNLAAGNRLDIEDLRFEDGTMQTAGAILATEATLVVRRSWFARNRAFSGGAIHITGAGGLLEIDTVEFVGNGAGQGGGIYSTVPGTVEDSVFEDNQGGSGGSMTGAAIAIADAPLRVRNSSFSGQHGGYSVISVDGATSAATLRLVNVTITRSNTLGVIVAEGDAELSVSNSIVAAQTYAGSPLVYLNTDAQFNTAASLNNLVDLPGHAGLVDGVDGNQVGISDPLVGALGDHGGPTRSLPLLPGSPALNAGDSVAADVPDSDQRGYPRVGAVDIGAFESRGYSLSLVGGSPQSTLVDSAFPDALVVQVSASDAAEPVAGGQVHFSAPASGASAVPATPVAVIGSNGQAQTVATANAIAGGPYVVSASIADGNGSMASVDFSLSNTSLTPPGITVNPASGLVTTEAGGSASFTVLLDTQPTADVAIPLASSSPDEGTVAPTTLTFTAANWNLAQTVTVTGVDDAEVDGDIAYVVVIGPPSSADPAYHGIDLPEVAVTNGDDDVPAGAPVAGAPLMIPANDHQGLLGLMVLIGLVGGIALRRRAPHRG